MEVQFLRKTLVAALALIAAMALCFTACGTRPENTINISRSTDTTALDLKSTDGTLVAELTGIPSTGYLWSYEIDNSSLIELEKTETKEDETDSGMTGTSHTDVYTFKAKGDGTAVINFHYSRNWEETGEDLHYEVEIKIEKGIITWMEIKNDDIPLPDEVKEFVTGSGETSSKSV